MSLVFGVATVFSVEDEQRRYTVSEAARMLGTTEAAVRARINRGKLVSEKIDNTVYVRLDPDTTPVHPGDQTALVEALRDQVTTLKQQLNTEQEASAELRRIIAGLVQRVPELERPEARETAAESEEKIEEESRPASGGAQEGTARVSWWRRMFGG